MHIIDTGLISKIYKDLTNQLEENTQNKTPKRYFLMDKIFECTFFSEDRQMTDMYVKRCSTVLIIRKMLIIKTVMSYHFTHVRIMIINKIKKIISVGKAVENREPL